jgi:hypothetical protein
MGLGIGIQYLVLVQHNHQFDDDDDERRFSHHPGLHHAVRPYSLSIRTEVPLDPTRVESFATLQKIIKRTALGLGCGGSQPGPV